MKYMIKNIVHDPLFLAQKSEMATKDDVYVARDLIDTLLANRDRCVGMAANMIGIRKNVIVFDNNGIPMVMFNPVIISKEDEYEAEEGCLSLSGTRKTKRYRKITVAYQNIMFEKKKDRYEGFVSEIIQHEIDHTNGILI